MHVSSLPSPYGIGSFGQTARRWVDFLRDAGQSYWQILPLDPTGDGDSPYQSFSAFAGNSYFIDLDSLCEDGLLKREEYANLRWGSSDKQVDFGLVHKNRDLVLRKAFSAFSDNAALDVFINENPWLDNYCLFLVIKEEQKFLPWMEWDKPLRKRDPEALERIRNTFSADLRYHAFVQFLFESQWSALRAYANEKHVDIIGDIPIYASLDSADVWSNPELFQVGVNGYPIEVSGCPPDSFSVDGQIWGNPIYDWEAMEKSGYQWWRQRLRSSFDLYDVLRIDHFRGLESYFAIPYGAETATKGKWRLGPGKGFIDAIKETLPDARIIAEDLGFLTDEVRDLLAYSGYPGMKLLQYAFDSREVGDYIPYGYTANTVVYTGTHDNDTVMGWSKNAPRECIQEAMEYMGVRRRSDLPGGMIRLALQSASGLAIIPMQDWLGLGSEARMNTPSTVGGINWRWRLSKGDINGKLAEKMARMTAMYGRMNDER